MKCPNCEQQAIKISGCLKGSNAFSTACISCETQLKASIFTYLIFSLTLVSALLFIPYIDSAFALFDVETNSSKLKIIAVLPIIIFGGSLGWLLGGYVAKK